MGTTVKYPVQDRVKTSFVIFDIWALMFSPEHQSTRMSKITSDGLTQSGTTRMLNSCTFVATVCIKGLMSG